MTRAGFRASDVAIAIAVASGAQWALFLAFSSSSPPPVRANISDENSRPIAVSITPVSTIPSGEHRQRPLPKAWQRHNPKPAVAQAAPLLGEPQPPAVVSPTPALPDAAVLAARSPPDAAVLAARPLPDAAVLAARPLPDAAVLAARPLPDAAPSGKIAAVPASSRAVTRSSPQRKEPIALTTAPPAHLERSTEATRPLPPPGPVAGSSGGMEGVSAAPRSNEPAGPGAEGEVDPLKAHAIALYRAELAAWFMARFDIRGKLPFATLKGLRARAVVTISPDHTVIGYTLAAKSGDPTFDAQVHATLAAIESSGAPLPAPPPLYPDLLGTSLPVNFECTSRIACE